MSSDSPAADSSASRENLERVGARLAGARRVVVVTGAGVSAESGVPTFRGRDGLYKGRDATTLASPEGFARDPVLVWEWYNWRRALIGAAAPNDAHRALVQWEARLAGFLLLTQNVDGLHQAAGSRRVHELHGNIWRTRDMESGRCYERGEIATDGPEQPPRSPGGGMLRPDVVWFGEMLPTAPFEAFARFTAPGDVDLCFVLGTTALLPYIGRFACRAQQRGAMVVEVNPEPNALGYCPDVVLASPAGEVLPALTRLAGWDD